MIIKMEFPDGGSARGTTVERRQKKNSVPWKTSPLENLMVQPLRSMRPKLQKWQKSVIRSLNGEDY